MKFGLIANINFVATIEVLDLIDFLMKQIIINKTIIFYFSHSFEFEIMIYMYII